jgi:hypothetical protein
MNSVYFFDVDTGGRVYADTVGVELANPDAALIEAIAILQEVARDVVSGSADRRFVATARDADGQQYFRATLTLKSEWLKR